MHAVAVKVLGDIVRAGSSAEHKDPPSAPLGAVGEAAGITTLRELIATARMKPGELRFGSTGEGTGTHLGIVKLNLEAGIDVVDVPPRPTDGTILPDPSVPYKDAAFSLLSHEPPLASNEKTKADLVAALTQWVQTDFEARIERALAEAKELHQTCVAEVDRRMRAA